MQVIHDLSKALISTETVLTVGSFDGLHLGHRSLLGQLTKRARDRGWLSGVVTFEPHPRSVLSEPNGAVCLISAEDKVETLKEWGLDLLVVLAFDLRLAQTSPHDFVKRLVDDLRMAELWVGPGFALGRRRQGDVVALSKLGEQLGFEVQVVEPVTDGPVMISSTTIRNLVADGRVREAAEMLGRYHRLKARLVAEYAPYPQMGLPSFLLHVHEQCAMPASGAYAAYVFLDGRRHLALVDIGSETVATRTARIVTVFLLDLAGEPEGQDYTVEFVEKLRGARRFADAEELTTQIQEDAERAREVLT